MKRRKIFSLVLAGVMLFSNITSFAATETTEVSESSTEITTESVTTEENSVETTTIEISDETSSIDETTETSEVTTEEDTTEEATTGFVNLSVSYDTLLSDVSFSVYDSDESLVAVYIVSDAKVSFIDLLVDKDILYEQDEETLLSLENGDYYLSMDETVYDEDSTPSDAGIVYDDSKVEFTVNSEDLNSPLEVEVSLEELVTEEVTETEEASEASSGATEDSSAIATPSDMSSDTEDITYVTAASETENAVSSEGIVLVTGTFGSLTAASAEVSSEDSDTDDADVSNDADSEEDTEIIVFDHYYSEIDESLVETTDLIVTTSDESIFTKNTNVISNYDNAYIISCETVEEAKYVYSYYVDKVDTISDLSKTISVATDVSEDVADLSDINNDDDALSTLNDIDTKTYSGYIALIDTGADADVNFSVIGDDTSDTNGHGTKMLNLIKENNPDAKVLSIKVSEGSKTDAASIYAGIMLAIESKVSVINLSMVGAASSENEIVKEAIEEAIASGITVIGAAGNYNISAKKFIPGSIDDVITVGAANEDGTKYSSSNTDADVYVVATSTSEATAIYTGLYTAGKLSDERIFTSLATDDEVSSDSDVDYVVNEDGSITFIVDSEYFEISDDEMSEKATKKLGEVNYSSLPSSTSGVEYGTCTVYSATNVGYAYAKDFEHKDSISKTGYTTQTSTSSMFTNFLSACGTSLSSFYICCERHWENTTNSRHAPCLEDGENKFFKATVADLDLTPDSEGKVSVTFNVLVCDRPNFYTSWADGSTSVEWSVDISPANVGTLYKVTYTVAGVTYTYSNGCQYDTNRDTIAGSVAEKVAALTQATADKDVEYGGVRNFSPSQTSVESSVLSSLPANYDYGNHAEGTVYYSWEETSQTQVYKGQVQAWAYANTYLTITKKVSDSGSSFIEYCEDDLGLDYYSLVDTKFVVYTDSSCSEIVKDVNGKNVTFTISANSDTDSDGNPYKTFELDSDYKNQTVFIVEEAVGTGYKYNSTYKSGKEVTLSDAGETKKVTIANTPMYDMFQWKLQKVSDVSGTTDWSGEINVGDASATYKITGYKLTASGGKGASFGTWYATTDDDGVINFQKESYYDKSNSSALYTSNDYVVFPIGYYTIEETAVDTSSGIEVSNKTYTYIISASSDSTGTDAVLKDGSTVICQRTCSNGTYTEDFNSAYADGTVFYTEEPEEWAKLGLFKTDEVYIEEGYTANNSVLKEDNAGTSFSGAVFNIYVDASKVSGFSASSFFTKPYDNHTYSLTKVSSVTVSDQLGNSKTINVSNLYQIYVDGSPLTITTKSTGSGVTDYKLPYSDAYVAYEVEAPEGFVYNTSRITFEDMNEWVSLSSLTTVTAPDGTTIQKSTKDSNSSYYYADIIAADNSTRTGMIPETGYYYGIKGTKGDSETSTEQGDANLNGIQFAVVNRTGSTVMLSDKYVTENLDNVTYSDGTVIANGGVVAIITTATIDGLQGVFYMNGLPYGKYEVYELRADNTLSVGDIYDSSSSKLGTSIYANKNASISGYPSMIFSALDLVYTLNSSTNKTIYTSDDNNTNVVNDVVRGGFAIEKVDYDLNENYAQGDATLKGATYAVYNRSANSVYVDGKTYAVDDVVLTFTTDGTGYYLSDPELLPYGTYEIVEITAPTGYKIDDSIDAVYTQTFSIREDGDYYVFGDDGLVDEVNTVYASRIKAGSIKLIQKEAFSDPVMRGGFAVEKADYDLDENYAQGDATLEGAVYYVYNESDHDVVVDKNGDGTLNPVSERFAPGEVCFTFTTDANGWYISAEDLLPYGTYKIVEIEAPEGYKIDDDIDAVYEQTFSIRADGEFYVFEDTDSELLAKVESTYKNAKITRIQVKSFTDPVIRAGFYIEKRDEETGDNVALGGASLNATYQVINRSVHDVVVDKNEDGYLDPVNERFAPGEVVFEFTTDADTGEYTSADDLLPYGTYDIVEIYPPEGYLYYSEINPTLTMTFSVREDKKIYTKGTYVNGEGETVESDLCTYNTVARGDIYFVKKNEDGEAMAYIPFLITSYDRNGNAIESHIVYTDENGVYSSASAYVLHTYNTNAGDDATYDDSTGLWSSDCKGRVGTWFGVDTVVSDKLWEALDTTGALPYGMYTLEELPCEANEGYDLITDTFYIGAEESETNEDIDPRYYQYGEDVSYVDFGTLINTTGDKTLKTEALTQDQESHYALTKKDLVIVDTVSYTGLEPGETYYLETTIVSTKDLSSAVDATGDESYAWTEFTTDPEGDGSGYIRTYTDMDATGLEGETYVVFEVLYDSEKNVVKTHRDVNDTLQQIHFPEITTALSNTSTGIQMLMPTKDVSLTDVITYDNLETGKVYYIKAWLMDADTGEKAVDDNGDEITYSAYVKASDTSGEWEITYEFDAETLAEKTYVSYVEISRNSNIVGEHKDLTDTTQMIKFPSIATSAIGTIENILYAGENVTVTDVVTYKNVFEGLTYTLKGTLIDKETGEALKDDNGNAVTATANFKAATEDGTASVTFTFDNVSNAGKTAVVYEELYYSGYEIAEHKDIDDESQTVYIPKIETTAYNPENNTQYVDASGNVTFVDTVSYENLVIGKEYTVTGILMDQKTGEEVTVDGKTVTSSATFTAEKTSGTVDVTFTFNAEDLSGAKVVFEYLYYSDTLIADHTDIDDESQTMHLVKIHTSAVDSQTEDHIAAYGETTFIDTVSYEGLVPGETYVISGYLVDKETADYLENTAGNTGISSLVNTILGRDSYYVGEVVVTPTEENGTATVKFTIDTTDLAGKTLVIYEELYYDGINIANHKEIDDEDQTIYITEIGTTAIGLDDTKLVEYGKEVTITDTVEYSNLIVGKEYTVSGYLVNEETGDPILNSEGEKITASKTFTAGNSEGSVDVVFTIDSTALAGQTLVAFESLEYNNITVAVHADITDVPQMVYVPEIHTTALDVNDSHLAPYSETVTDTVSYSNVVAGLTYTVSGYLVDETTGDPIVDESGDIITASKEFTAEDTEGTVDIVFNVSSEYLEGYTVVAFETLTYNTKTIAVHEDITDLEQTLYFPEIHTTAVGIDDTKLVAYGEEVTITDTVEYTNLIVGLDYTVSGTLVNKETEKELVDAEGNTITATKEFTAEATTGSVELTFTVDSTLLAGNTYVAFENMYYDGVLIAVHADIDDEDQTVYVPEIGTTATGIESTKIVAYGDTVTITDTVEYANLVPGLTYVMTGYLVDKSTGLAVTKANTATPSDATSEDPEAPVITATKEFTPEESSGTVEIVFTIDTRHISGMTLVAFETLTYNDIAVAVHEDIDDEAQTVYVPEIHTTATSLDDTKLVAYGDTVTVTDTVEYANLVAGETYTVSGTLVNKETGESLTDSEGNVITVEKSFTAESTSGSVVIEFTIDSTALAGNTYVAFEKMFYDNILIAVHADLEDEDQTVYVPKIATMATVNGEKTSEQGKESTLVDTVYYENLIVGYTYTVSGYLVDKSTGEAILDSEGNQITAETTFTAENTIGSVDMEFVFDSIGYPEVVVFENLYYNKTLIATHSDIDDENQTVGFATPTEATPSDGTPSTPKTGRSYLLITMLFALAIIFGATGVVIRKRSRRLE